MRYATLAATLVAACSVGLSATPSKSAEILWKVENPFRFFKRESSFAMYERAFDAVRGNPATALPDKIIWKTERRLNDPDCKDSSTPNACANSARAHYETSRLGWAAQTVNFTCYDRNARPRHYMTTCERQYSWGSAKEDYVLPDAHTVELWLAPDVLAALPAGSNCTWTWTPRRAGVAGETHQQPCRAKFLIKRLPYVLDLHTPPFRGRRQGETAGRPRTRRSRRERAGPLHRRVRRQLHVGRGQCRPAGGVQQQPRDGLRPDQLGHARRRVALACAELRDVVGADRLQPEVAAQALHGGRAEGAHLQPQQPGIPGGVRQGRGAVALARLPPLAIRLSVPREPSSSRSKTRIAP